MYLSIFLIIFSYLYANPEPAMITFQDLKTRSFHNQYVRIRGFLYEKDGHQVLAAEPNLKTCCIGSPHKIHNQIIIDPSINKQPSSRAVTVQGTLILNGEVLHLKNSQVLSEAGFSFWQILGGLAGLAGGIWMCKYWKN